MKNSFFTWSQPKEFVKNVESTLLNKIKTSVLAQDLKLNEKLFCVDFQSNFNCQLANFR